MSWLSVRGSFSADREGDYITRPIHREAILGKFLIKFHICPKSNSTFLYNRLEWDETWIPGNPKK